MKKHILIWFVLSACVLLTGVGTGAPLAPSKNYYVNDYAGVIFQEHRDSLSKYAQELESDTGVQLVVLTVEDLGGMEPAQLAAEIVEGWQIGGEEGNGLLLLVYPGENLSWIEVGPPLEAHISPVMVESLRTSVMAPYFADGNYSTGILNAWKDMAAALYRANGIQPDAHLIREQPAASRQGGISPAYLVLLALGIVVFLRALRVSHKYRQKYLYRHDPTRKRSFAAERDKNDDLTPDDKSKSRYYRPADQERETVRRSGFIIYRDKEETLPGDEKDD